VHERAKATGDTAAGKPYLRGSWKGNPYKEDGAPQAGQAYTGGTGTFGAVPRWSTSATNLMGGYWIDQNTALNTTALGMTATNSSGLCELCHGDGDATWEAGEVDNLNQFGTASTDWNGGYGQINGHSNAVLGGDGRSKVNIFDLRGGSASGNYYDAMARGAVADPGDISTTNVSFRNTAASTSDMLGLPVFGTTGQSAGSVPPTYAWGATIDAATTQVQYHKFSCSKCHNPHASRLPRLMITNCLDTEHNKWDDSYTVPVTASTATYGTVEAGHTWSNSGTAQNCHRKVGVRSTGEPVGATQGTSGNGWNNVTPWDE
jgi:hypothetical protein